MSNIPEDSVAWLDITALAKAAAGGMMSSLSCLDRFPPLIVDVPLPRVWSGNP